MEDVAGRIMRAAINASSSPTAEENSFSEIVGATRSLFRRQATPGWHEQSSSSKRRGRKAGASYRKKVFVIKLANSEFLPSPNEQKYLSKRGLGLLPQKIIIKRSWTREIIKEEILKLMPQHLRNLLQMAGFNIASCGKQRYLKRVHENSGVDIERCLGKGMLIVIPKTDFPSDLPLIHNYQSSSPLHNIDSNSDTLDINSDSDFEDFSVGNAGNIPENNAPRIPAVSRIPASNAIVLESVQQETTAETESYYSQIINELREDVDESNRVMVEDNDRAFLKLPCIEESAEVLLFNVERRNILLEMFQKYDEDLTVTRCRLSVRFMGEEGIDGGGLLNELFTIFWKELFRSGDYFMGSDVMIPYVILEKSKELKPRFVTIGKILDHMILLTGKFPQRLAVYTFTALSDKLCDYSKNEDLLLHDFLLFVSLPERKLISKALSQFEKCNEGEFARLISFYTTYGLDNVLPNKNNFKRHLLLMAENTLLEKNTADLYMKMREGLSQDVRDYLTNIPLDDIFKLWRSFQASPEKVVNILKLQPIFPTNQQDKIFYYLQNYILGLKLDELNNFLLFVTASVQLPEVILVDFHNGVGLARRPIVSTCVNLLKLGTTYYNQNDFDDEMNAVLCSEYSYVFDTH